MRTLTKGRTALAATAIAALTVSLLSTASPVASAPAAPTPAAAPAAADRGGDPWADPSYKPRRGQWRDYVLAPDDRLVRPSEVESVRARGGAVDGDPATLLTHDDDTIRITSSGRRADSPLVILDLGKEVSGPAQVRVTGASAERPELHVCYSESLQYLAQRAGQNDGQTAHAPGCDTANIWNGFPGTPYTADTDSHTLPLADAELPALLEDPELRGGYRYLTLFLDGPGWVEVDDVAMRFTAAQGQEDLDDYRGHFLSSDHLLNKIWYAGAYTVQINTDRPDTAKQWPYADGEGDHADDVVPGADPETDVIFDGGKRDRIVWQGDLAVQDPVAYVSTYDLPAVENSLSSLAGQQLDDGYLPAASQVGPHNAGELRVYGEYVTWFVSNMAEHYRWTGDLAYLQRWWPAMQRAVDWLEGQRDDTGLLSMAASGSCGHYGYRNCGHETYNNALYARILDQMAGLAADAGTPDARTTYADRAEAVRAAVNDQLWDEQVGAYRLSTEIPDRLPAGRQRGRGARRHRVADAGEAGDALPPAQQLDRHRCADRQPVHPQRLAAAVPRTAAELVRGRRATDRTRRIRAGAAERLRADASLLGLDAQAGPGLHLLGARAAGWQPQPGAVLEPRARLGRGADGLDDDQGARRLADRAGVPSVRGAPAPGLAELGRGHRADAARRRTRRLAARRP